MYQNPSSNYYYIYYIFIEYKKNNYIGMQCRLLFDIFTMLINVIGTFYMT